MFIPRHFYYHHWDCSEPPSEICVWLSVRVCSRDNRGVCRTQSQESSWKVLGASRKQWWGREDEGKDQFLCFWMSLSTYTTHAGCEPWPVPGHPSASCSILQIRTEQSCHTQILTEINSRKFVIFPSTRWMNIFIFWNCTAKGHMRQLHQAGGNCM